MRLPRQVMLPTPPTTLYGVGGPLLFSVLWVPFLMTIMNSVPMQLRLWRTMDRMLDRMILEDGESFDFIVVGAGLAGGVVANRLAKSGASVLLIEAGGEPCPLQVVPGFLMMMINRPETDWMYRSVPQKSASLNSVGAESSWSAGKGLGGTGSLNIMIYLRGHKNDFDNWAKIVDDTSWSYEGLMQNFKSIENYTRHLGKVDERYHGISGDMFIDEPDYLGIADQFVAAAGEFGYPRVDLNAPYAGGGFDRIKYPIKEGRRIASYFSFIQPVRQMESLTVLKYGHVNKVLLDKNNQAYGVEYEKFGVIKKALARKEVVLSSGSVNTAKILLLSGLGPKEHLESVGIPVKRDLPVGLNLQDHIGVYLHPFFINPPTKTVRFERDFTPSSLSSWLQSGSGVLSSSGVQASGTLPSSIAIARGESSWPDIHLFLFGFSATSQVADTVSTAFNLNQDEIKRYYTKADVEGDGRDSFNIIVTGARPFSRGHVRLASSDPTQSPLIDPKYLEDEHGTDLNVLLEAVKKSVAMVENSTALGADLGAVFTKNKLPGCEQYEMRSDEYWICYIRRYTVTLHHPVGTARMGREDDKSAVVDTRLRVRGVKGLRVVDSSIQPVIVVTNTGASAMMIGQKGATMILEDWRKVAEQEKERERGRDKQDLLSDKRTEQGTTEFNDNFDNRLKRRAGAY